MSPSVGLRAAERKYGDPLNTRKVGLLGIGLTKYKAPEYSVQIPYRCKYGIRDGAFGP